jgi:arrestin-related trafficking adapter 9
MPLETLFSNPLPVIPPPRSIISRITSPLAKRNRNIVDFSIKPEHQWKTYGPGDLVKGNVLLTVAKGFDVTHLVACLHGYVKVYKHQVVPGEAAVADGILDIRGGNQGAEYRGNGLVSLFQDEVALCGDGFLKKGIYKFGFELEFPGKSLPSSIDVSWILLVTYSHHLTIPLVRARNCVVFYHCDAHTSQQHCANDVLSSTHKVQRFD